MSTPVDLRRAPPFDLDRVGGRRAFTSLVEGVVEGGEAALRWWRSGGHAEAPESKGDGSPVTAADREVERRLRAWWRRWLPGATFLGEESGHGSGAGAEETGAGLRLVVDPIDGTQAFVRGLPSWSVLVALEDAHGPALAVAFLPAQGRLFTAVRGEGALGDGRPLRLSRTTELGEAMVLHGTLAQFVQAGREELLGRLARHTAAQRGPGDFEGYRLLLEGKADAVVDPALKPWDVSAPCLLVHEAGGRMTRFDGGPGHLGGDVVASNGPLHEALLRLLRA